MTTTTRKVQFEKRTLYLPHTHIVCRNGGFDIEEEILPLEGLVFNGLALHGVYGGAKVYWNITHVETGRKLTKKPKKFVRVPDAKKWLEYVSSLRDWSVSYQDTLKDSQRPIQTLLNIIEQYPDDRAGHDDEEDEDED